MEVVLTIRRACHYKAKPCKTCGRPRSNPIHRQKNVEEGKPYCAFRRQLGCARCGEPKSSTDHLGAPESFNVFAGRDPNVYRTIIGRWSAALEPLLEASGLPRPLDAVKASGTATFPDVSDRDQGNYRVIVEKALGDALVKGGWLTSDDWTRYEFGDLSYAYEPGVSQTVLVVGPMEREPASGQQATLALPV